MADLVILLLVSLAMVGAIVVWWKWAARQLPPPELEPLDVSSTETDETERRRSLLAVLRARLWLLIFLVVVALVAAWLTSG